MKNIPTTRQIKAASIYFAFIRRTELLNAKTDKKVWQARIDMHIYAFKKIFPIILLVISVLLLIFGYIEEGLTILLRLFDKFYK